MKTSNKDSDYTKEVYLTTAANSIEAESIETLLKANNIPVLKKFREAGAYMEIYMGASNFGVDLYVPSDLLETARDIIDSTLMDEEEIQPDVQDGAAVETDINYNRKQRALSWVIIIALMSGVLWIAAVLISRLLKWLIS